MKPEETTAKGGTAWTIPVAGLVGEEDPELLAVKGSKKRIVAAKTKTLEKEKTQETNKAKTLEEDDSFFEADGESSMDVVIDEEEKQRRKEA